MAVALYLIRSRGGPDPPLDRREPRLGPRARPAGPEGALLAILFGGACAGLAGAYLALVYTRFWSPGMTAGRGWIALALVVFAAWRPGWALVGAYIFGAATVLQLHAQAAQFGVPSQALSAVPISRPSWRSCSSSLRHGRAIGAPASLGVPFVPDR